jgi:hypothetical protein
MVSIPEWGPEIKLLFIIIRLRKNGNTAGAAGGVTNRSLKQKKTRRRWVRG